MNCDTFTLNVSGVPADWAGKIIPIKITWGNPLNDFDLFIHKDSNAGPVVAQSAGGAPSDTESTAIDPSRSGTGAYTIHVVYFAVAADQYNGEAKVDAAFVGRPAIYQKGGITFSANVTTKAPAARADGEPSTRTDKGNTWSVPVRVSDGPDTRTSLMPWMETGKLPGSVAVVWYGTS